MRAARRSVPRGIALLLTTALTGVLVLFGAGVASAHAYLRGSTPAEGSTVQGLPSTVVLDFNETIHNFEPVVVVTGPDGRNYATGAPSVVGNEVSSAVSPDAPAGAYSMAYRVVSADGHPVEGEVKFTVAAPAASSSAAPSSSSAGTRPSSTAPSTSPPGSATPSTGSTTGSAPSSSTVSSSAPQSTAVSSGSPSSPAASSPAASSSAPDSSAPPGSAVVGSSIPAGTAGGPVVETSSGPDWWIWAAIAVAAVVLAVAGVITLRRPHED